MLVIAHRAQVNDLRHRLAHTPFQRVGLTWRDVRVALFRVELITIQGRHRPGLFLVNIPSGPGGKHGRPVPQAGTRCRLVGLTWRVTSWHVNAGANGKIELLGMPRQRALGEQIPNAKCTFIVTASRQAFVDEWKQGVNADESAEKLGVRDPNYTRHVPVEE